MASFMAPKSSILEGLGRRQSAPPNWFGGRCRSNAMFDGGPSGSGCTSPEPSSSSLPSASRSSKRQYTLKGVEDETINLMRVAASKEGMKIGSWVSLRVKEAAERALADSPVNSVSSISNPDSPGDLISELCNVINAQREESEARFSRLERELHEITSGQRAIMAGLLTSRHI